jgi:DNA topoisomerase IB
VAGYLGNTPAVARSSYIDPRVIDRFTDGQAIDVATVGEHPGDLAVRAPLERAVLELIED